MYYNEWDKYAAQWLRNLIAKGLLPEGDVDDTDIRECSADRLQPTSHLFAGIGGWPIALQLAGWPIDRAVWTGSCPCQPFSIAGNETGAADERHLWPEMLRLIKVCRPPTIFGEQVASRLGREWLAGVRSDLEALGYAVGCADLCAAGVGAPHIRQRLFWVADSSDVRCERDKVFGQGAQASTVSWWMLEPSREGARFSDGKVRRVKSGVKLLVDGFPSRAPQLRAYGNAIVPQIAAQFIRSYLNVTATL